MMIGLLYRTILHERWPISHPAKSKALPHEEAPAHGVSCSSHGALTCVESGHRAGSGIQGVQRDSRPAEQGGEPGPYCSQGQAHALGSGGPQAASCHRHGRLPGTLHAATVWPPHAAIPRFKQPMHSVLVIVLSNRVFVGALLHCIAATHEAMAPTRLQTTAQRGGSKDYEHGLTLELLHLQELF